MKPTFQVAAPPSRPLLLYDGDCRFCALWVRRWQQTAAGQVDALSLQSPEVSARFPEIPRWQLESTVHLVETDGSIYTGAHAVFRTLAKDPHEHWLLDWYEQSPAFTRGTEWVYGLVSRHRGFFSTLTRFGWGPQPEPASYQLVRWVFLRALGLIYLIAFLSLWVQVIGLLGQNGILPANLTMGAVRHEMAAQHIGWGRFHLFPTFCWFNASDGFLKLQCALGAVAAVLLVIDFAPVPCLTLLWLLYLSLTVIGREFLGFQWDALLLETGFLAIFLAPIKLWKRAAPMTARRPFPILSLWLLRWLLFRLMFASGCVKLLSGDPTWRNLTALNYHYETQPLPTWIGWYAHQMPVWFQQTSTGVMFAIELVLPFFIFGPRRVRQLPCAAFVMLQLLILLTGNYCFFNLLAIALCVLLLDDAALRGVLPIKWRASARPPAASPARSQPDSDNDLAGRAGAAPPGGPKRVRFASLAEKVQRRLAVAVAGIFVVIPSIEFAWMFHLRVPLPGPVQGLYSWVAPFRSCNHYGLFAVMTTNRLEIIVEGSNDGITWLPYEFRYKPGDVKRRPGFVEPHQPRLDWQMWFAALGDFRENPWFVNFCVRLLQGRPEVLGLLVHNPFPTLPPRHVRAVAYEYHFTDWATRRRTGDWWARQPRGDYLPAISLRGAVEPGTQ